MTEDRRPTRRRGVESNLRTAAVWAEVAELTAERQQELGRSLRVLDLGGGTGGLAVPLAEQGRLFSRFFRSSLSVADEIQGIVIDHA